MASLKEIKERIATVGSSEKVTSAMRMISSAKLKKAEKAIENMRPYQQSLNKTLTDLLGFYKCDSSLTAKPKVKRIVIVALSSDSSLCGAFNANIIKQLAKSVEEYSSLGRDNIEIYPIGKKVVDATKRMGFTPNESGVDAQKPTYIQCEVFSKRLIEMFEQRMVDRVVLLYHRYFSVSHLEVQQETFLPMTIENTIEDHHFLEDYIIEPDPKSILTKLLPMTLSLKIYSVMLDSICSEHASRMIAMQGAGDNAKKLLDELRLQMNKSRQSAITAELLDIVGGTMVDD